MPPDPQTLLASALHRGDFLTAQAQLKLLNQSATNYILTRADVLRNVGQPQRTLDVLARELSLDQLRHPHRGRACRIKGEAEGALGLADVALQSLETAILESEASQEYGEVALACLSRFTLLVNLRAETESQPALDRARRAVARSANTHLLAWLHARVGQAHAQLGLAAPAVNHLESALEITSNDEYLPLTAFASLALCGAEFLLARYRRARMWAKRAEAAAMEGGLQHLVAAAKANRALLEYRLGHLPLARRLCEELLEDSSLPPLIAGPILDTLACVCLSEGNIEEAGKLVQRVVEVVSKTGDSTFLSVDVTPTVAFYHQSTGEAQKADEQLSLGIERALRRGDRASLCKLLLLRAELRLGTGQRDQGTADLLQARATVERLPLDIIALESRVAGLNYAAANERRDATLAFTRAIRLFKHSGDRTSLKRTRALRAGASSLQHNTTSASRSANERSTNRLCEDITHILGLIPYPEVLGHELAHVLSRVAPGVAVKTTVGSAHEAGDGCAHEVVLGSIGDSTFCLSVDISRASESSIVVCRTLIRIVVGAVSAERALQRGAALALGTRDQSQSIEGRFGLFAAESMQRLLKVARQSAKTDLPILILGETGTGKEVLAAEIHASSRRADKPFIPLNVTAVSRDLLESQLFGSRKGSFTGATHDTKGLLREADGGTVFLDEIGEMSLELQPKLLRFVEQGEIQPVGERPQHVDVRIIAATNASLLDLVRQGRFREDLYHRLRVVPLTIPPLRERREEVATLAHHFIERHAAAARRAVPDITPRALERLVAAEWPGNVRQLNNELRRIVALLPDDAVIDVEHLSAELQQPGPISPLSQDAPTGRLSLSLDRPLAGLIDDLERAAIQRAMTLCGGNISEVARRLGVTRKGLYLKRQRLGMDEE